MHAAACTCGKNVRGFEGLSYRCDWSVVRWSAGSVKEGVGLGAAKLSRGAQGQRCTIRESNLTNVALYFAFGRLFSGFDHRVAKHRMLAVNSVALVGIFVEHF